MDELIYRRLNGTASTEDEEQLLEWLESADENKQHYLHCVRLHAKLSKQASLVDKGEALHKIKQQLDFGKTVSINKPQSNSRLRIITVAVASVAAVVVALVIFSRPPAAPQIALQEYTADSVNTLTLSDSSRVYLNDGSKLVAEKIFASNRRSVKLQGNAFFEVTKKPAAPFVISVGHVEVKVLGTSFDIDETDNAVKVSVATGRVQITDTATQQSVILTANQQCTFTKNSGSGEIIELSDQNYLAWHTGVLLFKNEPLQNALMLINEHYSQNIQLADSEMANCPFSSKFDNIQFEDVLTVLQIAFDGEIDSTQAGKIILKGVSCYN